MSLTDQVLMQHDYSPDLALPVKMFLLCDSELTQCIDDITVRVDPDWLYFVSQLQ